MSRGKWTASSKLARQFQILLEGVPESQALGLLAVFEQARSDGKWQPGSKIFNLVQQLLEGVPEPKASALLGLLSQVAQDQAQGSIQAREALQAQHALELEAAREDLAETKKALRAAQAEKMQALRRRQARRIAALEAQHEADIALLRQSIRLLTGPGHIPPPSARLVVSEVARPPIQATYWEDLPWKCLRLEERTVGHHRESAYLRLDTGRPALRFHPETEKWMRWALGIAEDLQLLPTQSQVRVAFFSGLAYTFLAWMEVPAREVGLLHPMDPDNVVKATLDALQTKPYQGEERQFGIYENDTQIVDLLVFRLPQDGAPPVDRLALSRAARAKRKAKALLNPKPRKKRLRRIRIFKASPRMLRKLRPRN